MLAFDAARSRGRKGVHALAARQTAQELAQLEHYQDTRHAQL